MNDLNFEMVVAKATEKAKKLAEFISVKSIAVSALSSFVLALSISLGAAQFLISMDDKKGGKSAAAGGVTAVVQERSIDDSDLDLIFSRNLFNSEGTLGDQEVEQVKEDVVTDEIIKSNLPLKLVGTIYSGDPYSGIALVEETSKSKTNSFMVGERITPETVVEQILKEKIILKRGQQLEYIELEKKPLVRRKRGNKPKEEAAPAPNAPKKMADSGRINDFKEEGFEQKEGRIKMTEAYRRGLLTGDNFTKMLQDAKAEPNMVDGQLRGFKLMRIRTPSIYEKAGLVNGDIVTAINGIELTSVPQAISTLKSVQKANQIEVTVIQGGGVERTIEVSIGQ